MIPRMRGFVRRYARAQGAARLGWLLGVVGILLAVGVVVLEVSPPPLHWAREHWLNAAAITAAATTALVVAPFIIRWLDRRRPVQATGLVRDAQQRAIMLRRVRYNWISGVLEPSLARDARLVLGLERRPDLLGLGGRAVRRPGQPSQPLPEGVAISDVFDQVGGGLLILGTPGAGKTTALLQLCDELLNRAEHDLNQPIPVVFNLASWARHRPPLGAWLVDELASGYQVPRRIGAEWIEHDELALLLDGLDEVADAHRTACAEAVNAWRHEHGLVPMVVCCRTHELQALGPRLRLEEAVELQPPSDDEVDRYLGYLEATGTPLADVYAALAVDRELRQLLRSPLLLHVVALAYHGRPAPALYAPGTLEQRQTRLWEAYVKRVMEQHPLDPECGYTVEQALGWLAWLARALCDRDQTEFHLGRLTPDWLPTPIRQRRARFVTWLACGMVAGLTFGLAFGLVARTFGLPGGLGSTLLGGLSAGLSAAVVGALVFGLPGGLATGPVAGMVRVLASRLPDKRAVPSVGIRGWAHHAPVAAAFGLVAGLVAGLAGGLASGFAAGLTGGLAFGLAAGLSFGVVVGLVAGLSSRVTAGLAAGLAGGLTVSIEPAEQVRWSWSKLRAGMVGGLAAGLVGGLGFGLLGVLIDGLSRGLRNGLAVGLGATLVGGLSPGLRNEQARPNEGIRRSAQYALVVGLAAGVVGGLSGRLAAGMATGLAFGLAFAVSVAMVFGGAACLQHYVVRVLLVRERSAPWHYSPFLEAMAERLLLRRSGSAYLFVHRLLRDYLAGPDSNRIEAAGRAASGGR